MEALQRMTLGLAFAERPSAAARAVLLLLGSFGGEGGSGTAR